MWTLHEPPKPNTQQFNWLEKTENATYPDTETNCWYPCIGGNVNGLTIPDLRGRMPVGYGNLDGNQNPDSKHLYKDLNLITGGIVPVADHKHPISHQAKKISTTVQNLPNDIYRRLKSELGTSNYDMDSTDFTHNIGNPDSVVDPQSSKG